MQWLYFVNELDCYKGKENKLHLLNIIQVVCSHNKVTLKDIRYSIKKIIIVILIRLFTPGGGGVLGVKGQPPFSQNWGPNQKSIINA